MVSGRAVRAAAIAAVGILGLIWMGCGGGGAEKLSKAEFVKQANAICSKAEKEKEEVVARASETLSGKVTAAEKEEVILEALAPYEMATEKVSELGAPSGQEAKVEAIVEAMEEGAEKVQASPTTALVSELPVRKANELTKKFGLTDCRF